MHRPLHWRKQGYVACIYLLNIVLAFCIFFLAVGLTAPLLGGVLPVQKTINAGQLIIYFSILKLYPQRRLKDIEIDVYDLAICISIVAFNFFLFGFPFNILISIFSVMPVAYEYKEQERRKNQESGTNK